MKRARREEKFILRLKWLGLTPKLTVLALRARLRVEMKISMTISTKARLAASLQSPVFNGRLFSQLFEIGTDLR